MWEIEVNERLKENRKKKLEKFKENTQYQIQDVQTTMKSAYSSLKWLTALPKTARAQIAFIVCL